MNNYDNNSSGTSIKFSYIYDTIKAQMYYDDNFKLFGKTLFYSNFGQHELPVLEDLYKFRIKNYRKVLEFLDEDAENYRINGKLEKQYIKDYLHDELQELLDKSQFDEIEDILFSLDINYKKTFNIISSMGYLQGDYAEVIVYNEDIYPSIGEYINNLLWDSPISFGLQIDDVEIVGGDFLSNEYEMDEDLLYKYIEEHLELNEKQKQETIKFLKENLQEYPECQ